MKLFFAILSLIVISSTYQNDAEIKTVNRNYKPRISLFLKSNKTICTQANDVVNFDISISNQFMIPIIENISCVSFYDWKRYNIILKIVYDGQEYMKHICNDKCATITKIILIKGHPYSIAVDVGFNDLIKQRDKDFLVRKNNTDYGSYTIQAAYILKKDTLYSNKILVEFKKE